MTTLRELRAEDLTPALRELVDGHALRLATVKARKFLRDTGIGLAFAAAAGAVGGWHAAGAALGATAGALAIRLWIDRVGTRHRAMLDAPGGRRVTFGSLARIDAGALGIHRGYAWAVYETPESQPRIMSNSEFETFRLKVPNVVEVRAGRGMITVGRYTGGMVDSSATGLPGHEFYRPDGTRIKTDWFVMGHDATMEEALIAHVALRDEAAAAPTP